MKTPPSLKSPPPTKEPTSTKPPPSINEVLKELQETKDEFESFKNCIICHERVRNCLFVKCMHVVTCWDCSHLKGRFGEDKVTDCPACRKPIKEKLKVFI